MKRLSAVISVTLAALLSAAVLSPPAHATVGSTTQKVRIPVDDGTELSALVITPTGTEGPHPLLVMPRPGPRTNCSVGRPGNSRIRHQVIATPPAASTNPGADRSRGPRTSPTPAPHDWALANTDADRPRGMAASPTAQAACSPPPKTTGSAVGAMSGWADHRLHLPQRNLQHPGRRTPALLRPPPGGRHPQEMEQGYRPATSRLDAAPVPPRDQIDAINATAPRS